MKKRFGRFRRLKASSLAAWLAAFLALSGCARSPEPPSAGEPARPAGAVVTASASDAAKAGALPSARKVIRSAELTLEVDSPAKTQAELTTIAEQAGGYVASSEREVDGDEGEQRVSRVSAVLRVPSERLAATLTRLKHLGRGAESERLGSEDVSDEYIDLTARIANQKRLEATLAGLLTQASSVDAALQVHKELSNVRTEIDRMEGRRQFLERETDFAKISVTLSTLRPVLRVSLAEFGVSFRRAGADSVSLAAAVVLGGVRLLGVLMPIFVLFGAPGWVLWRLLRRRQARFAAALQT
jgi:hypothetical protein